MHPQFSWYKLHPLTRRAFLCRMLAAGGAMTLGPHVALGTPIEADFWWRHIIPFAQTDDSDLFFQCLAQMDIFGFDSDPTWGPYAQRLTELGSKRGFRSLKAHGTRVITYIEGFGDCMLYAARLNRYSNGAFQKRVDDPSLPLLVRTAWNWGDDALPEGSVTRWIGIQNTVNDEDFIPHTDSSASRGLPIPKYPDGQPAVGWMSDDHYPLNARIFDACGSKDINGNLHPGFEAPPGFDQMTHEGKRPKWVIDGLYPAVIGIDDAPSAPGLKQGDTLYCGIISVHKDLSAPFWREYARVSVREMLKNGIDGVWCDNFSPWDNFGYPPVQKAFGDWSLHRFTQYLSGMRSTNLLHRISMKNGQYDLRNYLKTKALEFGGKDVSKCEDPAWSDARWLEDPIWSAFKACRQKWGQHDLREFYYAIHDEANKAKRPDFCIGGNDIPLYGLGWVHNDWLDMVNTEVTPGWHMGTGSRGVMIPPAGKMAVVYRAALEHQEGPYVGAWYYLDGPLYRKYQQKPGIAKTLLAEAFANGAFLMCDPGEKKVVGTVETHAWWNRFILSNAEYFEQRVPLADIGILFSPDNQLALLAPGGFPDMDRQPHIFGHWGWATAMIDSHLPYRAVTDWNLDDRSLAGLRTFIIPDAECLDDRAGETMEKWVRGGGRLIITGPMGTRYGPARNFQRRRNSLFSHLIGSEAMDNPQSPGETGLGDGVIYWTPDTIGMNYYLNAADRKSLLPQLKHIAGGSALIKAADLPSSIGVFLWRSKDSNSIFVDIVNYDINLESDQIRPVEDIVFQVPLPKSWESAEVMAISPEEGLLASANVNRGRPEVHIHRLTNYASVKLIRR